MVSQLPEETVPCSDNGLSRLFLVQPDPPSGVETLQRWKITFVNAFVHGECTAQRIRAGITDAQQIEGCL